MKKANIREFLKRKRTKENGAALSDESSARIRSILADSGTMMFTVVAAVVIMLSIAIFSERPAATSEQMGDGVVMTAMVVTTEPPTVRNLSESATSTSTTITTTTTTTTTTVTTTALIVTTTTTMITTAPPPVTTTPPVVETSPPPEPAASVDTSNMRYLGNMRTTGYLATGHNTASGETPYVGGVAMNRSYGLPWGTKIYIEGFGYYTVNDTGCRTGIVDIFCNTLQECRNVTTHRDVWVVNE